jgi:hypothetical protein
MIISNILSGKNEEKWIFIYLGNGVCTSYAWEMVLDYIVIPPLPEGGGGYTVLPLSVQDIFRRIFLNNC